MIIDYFNEHQLKDLALRLKWYPEAYWADFFVLDETVADYLRGYITEVSDIEPEKWGYGYTFCNNHVRITITVGIKGNFLGRRSDLVVCDDAYSISEYAYQFRPLAANLNGECYALDTETILTRLHYREKEVNE